jgi:hypothetical protein
VAIGDVDLQQARIDYELRLAAEAELAAIRAATALAVTSSPTPPPPQANEEQTQFFTAKVGRPSSFMPYMDRDHGARIQRVVRAKLPVYEMAKFERQVFFASATIVGTGAATAIFDFIPPVDFPSFRVMQCVISNEATIQQIYLLQKRVPLPDGSTAGFRMAALDIEFGSQSPMVTESGQVFLNAGLSSSRWVSSRFDVFCNKSNGIANERIRVVSIGNITLADEVTVFLELESIPDAARFSDISQTLIATP